MTVLLVERLVRDILPDRGLCSDVSTQDQSRGEQQIQKVVVVLVCVVLCLAGQARGNVALERS